MTEGPSVQVAGEQVAIGVYGGLDQQILGNIELGSQEVTTSNDPSSAHGQHITNYGANDEKVAEPRPRQQRKRPASTGGKLPTQEKRARGPDWEEEEKYHFLAVKLKVSIISATNHPLGKSEAQTRGWASKYISKRVGKSIDSCNGQWDNLQKAYKAISDHESKVGKGEFSHDSYWKMDDHLRREANEERRRDKLRELPRVFPKPWFEIMESIRYMKDFQKAGSGSRNETKSNIVPSTVMDPAKDLWTTTSPLASTEFKTDLDSSEEGPSSQGPQGAIKSMLPSSSHHNQKSAIPLTALTSDTLASTLQTSFQATQRVDDESLPLDEYKINSLSDRMIQEKLEPFLAALQACREDVKKNQDKVIEKAKLKLARKLEKYHSKAVQVPLQHPVQLTRNEVFSLGNASTYSRTEAGPMAYNGETSSANIPHANYQLGNQALSNANYGEAFLIYGYGGQATKSDAHPNFQTSSAYHGRYWNSSCDSLIATIDPGSQSNAANYLGRSYDIPAGTVANSNVQTSTASLGNHGQHSATYFRDSSIGPANIHQPHASFPAATIHHTMDGQQFDRHAPGSSSGVVNTLLHQTEQGAHIQQPLSIGPANIHQPHASFPAATIHHTMDGQQFDRHAPGSSSGVVNTFLHQTEQGAHIQQPLSIGPANIHQPHASFPAATIHHTMDGQQFDRHAPGSSSGVVNTLLHQTEQGAHIQQPLSIGPANIHQPHASFPAATIHHTMDGQQFDRHAPGSSSGVVNTFLHQTEQGAHIQQPLSLERIGASDEDRHAPGSSSCVANTLQFQSQQDDICFNGGLGQFDPTSIFGENASASQ